MKRVLVFLMCAGLICLDPVLSYAQMGRFGGFGRKTNPALEGKKIVNKIVLYNSSEYDNKKSGQMIAHEKIKREILESVRSEVMYSYRQECPGQSSISPEDFIALMSSVFQMDEGNDDWDDGVLEYQAIVGISTSDMAKVLCYISGDKSMITHIMKNQKYADDAFEKIFQMQYEPYSRSKQASYDRQVDIVQASNYFKKGVLAGLVKNTDEAIDDYTEAIELNPQFPEAYYQRAIVYRGISENQRAIDDYSQAIRLDGKESLYYASRALCYFDAGNFESVMKDLNTLIEMSPSSSDLHTAYVLRGTVHEKYGEDEKALNDYEKAIEINPKAADIYFRKGLINRRLKNYEKSIEDFCHVIELDNKNGNAYYERGTTYAYLQDKDNVLKDFKTAARYGNAEAREFLKSKNIKWE